VITDLNSTSGTTSYFTTLANAISNTSPIAITTAVSASGTYFIRKTAGCGFDVKPVTVTINALPTPTFTVSSSNVCAGSSSVVFTTQSGMTGYTWNITGVGNSIVSGAGTNSVITSWGSNGGNITLNYTNPNGCNAASAISQAVTITPLATPTFTATGTNPVCQGATAQTFTTQTGRSNYLWSVVGGTITAGGGNTNSATITWNTPGAGVVAVNYSNAASPLCFASSYTSANITVNAPPAITAQPTAPTVVCSGAGTQTISVTATGTGLTYSWRKGGIPVVNGAVFSGQGTNTLTLTNPAVADAGSYDVVITGTCTPSVTSSAVTVSVNPLPQGSISGNTVCLGGQSQFTFTATTGTGPYTLIIGGTTYTNVVSGTPFNGPAPSSTTSYTLTSITDANGCVRTSGITGASATLTINTAPAITSQPVAPTVTCSGSGAQTISVTATGAGLTYSWRKGGVAVTNGAVFSGQGTNTLTLTNPLIADAGSYDVVISGTCPASVTSSAVTVGVNPLPQGSISGNTVCSGDQSQFIFTATTGTGPYTLNIGGTFYTNVISGTPFNGPAPSSTTPYTLTSITDANGCVRTTGITGATASITVSQQPTANAGGNVSICQGTSHLVSGASSSNGTILWTHNGAGTLTNATTITPTYNSTVADAGNTVTLTLTVSNAPCSNAVSSLNITVDRLPTISIAGTAPHAITCGTGSVTIGPTEVTIAFASAINWTTSSGGSITAPTTVTPTYAAINANAGNTVVLTGTVTGTGGCSAETASSNYSIAVRPNPIVSVSGGIINGTSVFYNTLAVTNDDGVSVYTWLPATDLYLNPGLTIPYVSGTDASVVYASPFITTTYAVRANRDGCLTQPTNAIVNVSSALTDNICLADAPSGLVAVTNTPSFVLRTLTGSTPSPGSSCGIPISNDVWFRAIVPSTGEVHVMTRQHTNPNPVFNINRSFVQIFSATNCTTGLTMVACNADGAAGSHAYAAATNLAVGSTVYIRLGKVNDPINPGPANQIQLAVTSGLVWTGIADNNFANPANWHGGDATALTVPGASTTAIIPYSTSNIYPVVTGTQSAHGLIFNGAGSLISTLTINTGSELRLVASSLNQSFISRSGSFLPADILGGGTLSFFGGGNNQAAILSSGIRCSGIVGVRTGVTLSTGAANLTIQNNGQLLSGGVELATLGFGGTVSGTIRYIRSGSLYGKYNYWSSPVSGVTTAVLNTNYGHNLYDYDNTRAGAVINVQKGWDYIPSTPEIDRITSPVSMTSGKGFIQTYAGDGTVSFIGAPMETTVNIPVTKTSTNGFNLVGNPYPSSISYNRLKANNASLGTVYLWRSASDGSINPSAYVVIAPTGLVVGNTAGLLPWNAEIGGGQGFLADIASTGTLQFNSSQRVVAGNATQFLDANALTYMRVRLSNISNQAFDAIIGFDQNATDAYDFNYDAPRMPSSDSLELFTYIGEAEYTAKFEAPLVATKIVDLGTSIIGTGTFTLSMPEFLNFDPSVRVFIEDVKAGTFNPFSTSAPYSFTNDPSFDGVRFRLHFMAPVQFASEGACVDQENGKIIVANPNENHPLTAAIHSSIDGIVISDSAPFTGEHIFTNLAGGDYMLQITYPNAEPANMAVEVVSEGEQSAPIVSASATNVSIADAIIEFNASAEGAIAYTWNFGDGTTLTGVSNPVHAYMEPGVYVVTCEAIGQAGCSASATLEISVDANITQVNELLSTEAGMHVFPNPASHQSNIVLNLGESAYSDLVLRITDAAGRVVLMKEIANVKSGAMVSIPTDGFANGIYQIVVEGQKFKQVRKLTIAK
ncbi:MAG: PKD domain-containing protein, partial [Bacteroidia bacterium]